MINHNIQGLNKYKCFEINVIIINKTFIWEASRGAAARGVTVKPTGCGFDPHSRR